jgi:hypothetical protein
MVYLNLTHEQASAAEVSALDGSRAKPARAGEVEAYSLGGEALLIAGLPADLWATGLRPYPDPPRDPDLAGAQEVSVSLGPETRESGLYNVALRSRRGGAVEPTVIAGKGCVRTRLSPKPDKTNPYVYLDVDDDYAYLLEGATPVEVIVEVMEAGAARSGGFNLCYDSVRGQCFSQWQWVEAGNGWREYRFLLNDANFANKSGYDLRINAAGSREDIAVASVVVRKLRRG